MIMTKRSRVGDAPWQSTLAAVPEHYRGVWRRTLLQTPQGRDTTSIVYWLQTAHWHGDLRIPAHRPDFSGVNRLADCNAEQMAFLASQQGFAGATDVSVSAQGELCAWHRRIDLQPSAAGPDAGLMQFTPDQLIETGLYASYLEHWTSEAGSTTGSVVLQRLQQPQQPQQSQQRQELQHEQAVEAGDVGASIAALPVELLMVAGDSVMHIRGRTATWPPETLAGTQLVQMPQNLLPALLDFSIAYGQRTATGWVVEHATHPWLEGRHIALACEQIGTDQARMQRNGELSYWQVLEWQEPR